jgi:vacuolar protein sorting-associated protein 33A
LDLLTISPRPQHAPTPYPHAQLRKSLRLLIDAEDIPTNAGGEDRSQDEVDISYVYSGWAPLSIRLIQCVTQKEGVYANPNTQGGRKQQQKSTSSNAGEQDSQSQSAGKKMKNPAQPITGWKGFEDVIGLVPGDTFDITLRDSSKDHKTLNDKLSQSREANSSVTQIIRTDSCHIKGSSVTTSVLFFLGGVTYTEIAAIRWMSRQQTGSFRFLMHKSYY